MDTPETSRDATLFSREESQRIIDHDKRLQDDNDARIDYCRERNDAEVQRLRGDLTVLRERVANNSDPVSIRRRRYCEQIEGWFIKWYDEYHRTMPDTRTLWTRTKSEWCRMVSGQYRRSQGEYSSFRDAVNKEFCHYRFQGDWTPGQAYDLSKKL
jgi:hypothetical protein